jgi:hypothetical protein
VLELVLPKFLVGVDDFPFFLILYDFEHVFVVEEAVVTRLPAHEEIVLLAFQNKFLEMLEIGLAEQNFGEFLLFELAGCVLVAEFFDKKLCVEIRVLGHDFFEEQSLDQPLVLLKDGRVFKLVFVVVIK